MNPIRVLVVIAVSVWQIQSRECIVVVDDNFLSATAPALEEHNTTHTFETGGSQSAIERNAASILEFSEDGPSTQAAESADSDVKEAQNISILSAFHPPLKYDLWSILLSQLPIGNYDVTLNLTSNDTHQSYSIPNGDHEPRGEQEKDIPSFEEWRQEKLAEKEKIEQAFGNSSLKRRPRNVKNTNKALVVCGAKVVAYNPEAENVNGILSSNPDEYMLIPCKAPRKYFIIELCESIRIQSIEIGNMELFSNVPKVINFAGATRFPTRDWVDLGNFDMREARVIQNYTIEEGTGFIKYVKVEYLEHYGKEHYCPLSVIKVFGSGMVDEYIDSVDDDDQDELDHAANQQPPTGTSTTDDAFMENDKWQPVLIPPVNPIALAKDLIVNLVKKATSNGYSLMGGDGKNASPAPCANATAAVLDLDLIRADIDEHHRVPISSPLLQLCLNQRTSQHGLTCQYVWCLLQASNSSLSFCPDSKFLKASKISYASNEETPSCTHQDHIVQDDRQSAFEENLNATNGSTESPNPLPAEDTVKKAASSSEAVSETETVKPPVIPESVSKPIEEANGRVGVPQNSQSTTETVPVETRDKPSEIRHQEQPSQSPPESTNFTMPNGFAVQNAPSQKESVFVRLGNRLKALESNMTLSGEYLHELSRRFKRQGEDTAKNFTTLFLKMSDVMKAAADQRHSLASRLDALEAEKTALQSRIESLESDLYIYKTIAPYALGAAFSFVVIIAWMTLRSIKSSLKVEIAKEASRLLAHSHTNGHAYANGSAVKSNEKVEEIDEEESHSDSAIGRCDLDEDVQVKKKRKKKRRKRELRLGSVLRMVPCS